jgi:hypothetical protein
MLIFSKHACYQYRTDDNPAGKFDSMNTGFIQVETVKYLYDNTPFKGDSK